MQENNRNELDRLDRERREDFLSMLKGFIVNQVSIVFLCLCQFFPVVCFGGERKIVYMTLED